MLAPRPGERHCLYCTKQEAYLSFAPKRDSVFSDSFQYKHPRRDSMEQKAVRALLKRCAEMEVDGELSPKFYKHLNSCLLFQN